MGFDYAHFVKGLEMKANGKPFFDVISDILKVRGHKGWHHIVFLDRK